MKHILKTLVAPALLALTASPAFADVAPPDTTAQCAPISLTIYFSADEAELSTYAAAALAVQAEDAQDCLVSTIEATAISTDGGASLSEARSEAVIVALSELGIATTDTVTHIADAPEGPVLAPARRVDLVLTTLPDLINS